MGRSRFGIKLKWLGPDRLLWLRAIALLSGLFCAFVPAAYATAYTFPGALPSGCSGSGLSYTCSALSLGSSDTIAIGATKGITITVNGTLSTNISSINSAGSASDLTLVVNGVLALGYQTTINAHITAQSVTDAAGGYCVLGGNLTTSTGDITLAYMTSVAGSVTSTSGNLTIGQLGTVGGSVTSTSGNINISTQATVTGAVTTGSAGTVTLGQDAIVNGAITAATGAVSIGYNAKANNKTTTTSGAISFAQSATAGACVKSTSGTITLGYQAVINSVCCGSGTCGSACVTNNSTYATPATCAASGPHHLVIQHGSGTGVTCAPSTLTIAACADSSCATAYTGGVTGTLTATGSGMSVNWASGAGFTIASGSSSTTESVQVTTPGSVVLGTTSVSPAATSATTCNFGSPSCTFTASTSGLLFSVSNHVSDVSQTVSVSAVRSSDSATVCTPAFASVSKSVTFACSYTNPSTGTLPVRVGGTALNAAGNASAACDAGGKAVSLAFNASGVASTTVQYADVGQMLLSATYTGSGSDAGLTMTGSDSFIAAPSSFAISGVTVGPIKAGVAFGATVTARNASLTTTPNFGRETSPQSATLTFARAKPTGTGVSDGVFSGSLGAFSAGVATSANLVWSEVGYGDLTATLTSGNYLSSGLSATGTTGTAGAVGAFTPHHFTVAVTPACSGSFTYAGQPFSATVTAMNGLSTPTVTVNYDGGGVKTPSYAKTVTLSEATSLGVGTFNGTGILASSFASGVATVATPTYTFTSKATTPKTLTVRAVDADSISSSGYAEGSTTLRSGRLRLSNAFGGESAALQLPVTAQYWNGKAWITNSADSCTSLAATSVVRSNYLNSLGASTAAWTTTPSAITLSSGNGTLTLSAPSPKQTGSVSLALNLGATTTDQSCLSTHPASVAANLPWLRSQYGNCATSWASDPSARASFGVYSPETQKLVFVRDLF